VSEIVPSEFSLCVCFPARVMALVDRERCFQQNGGEGGGSGGGRYQGLLCFYPTLHP